MISSTTESKSLHRKLVSSVSPMNDMQSLYVFQGYVISEVTQGRGHSTDEGGACFSSFKLSTFPRVDHSLKGE